MVFGGENDQPKLSSEVIITNLADHIVPLPTDFLTQPLVPMTDPAGRASRDATTVGVVASQLADWSPKEIGKISAQCGPLRLPLANLMHPLRLWIFTEAQGIVQKHAHQRGTKLTDAGFTVNRTGGLSAQEEPCLHGDRADTVKGPPFVAGAAALCEPRSADFVASAGLSEP